MDITALYKIFLECTSVTTDSRNCPEGSLFIALKGDNFNGNAFATYLELPDRIHTDVVIVDIPLQSNTPS